MWAGLLGIELACWEVHVKVVRDVLGTLPKEEFMECKRLHNWKKLSENF